MRVRAVVAGVGIVPFTAPGRSRPYTVMGATAARAALADAGMDYPAVQQAYVGYVYGDSAVGQAVLHELGPTGLPVFNVNNHCASGSTALFLGRQAVEFGAADVVLVLGVEQMRPGAPETLYTDRPTPYDRYFQVMQRVPALAEAPIAAQLYGEAGEEYIRRYGADPQTFARIAVKARAHAAGNPNALSTEPVTVQQVLASGPVHGPLTRLQCSPPTCGAAAAVLVSERFARRCGCTGPAITAQAMGSDSAATFLGADPTKIVGYDSSKVAAHQVYEQAGIGPAELPVVELHDSFTTGEILAYEALGLTPEGTAERFVADAANTYGGQVVTNPSGGMLAKGHPLGATGVAQCAELVWQLRGQAGARQVDYANLALQHNVGLGGATVVTLYANTGSIHR
ncbi:lipid-transfer protein [Nocardia rhamnosiphila]|uniref:thiolase C-terminal domain-containing protein n=1 Tax=Nocardia rhamnosiphila TaxID=426716 RepID=UPI0034047842